MLKWAINEPRQSYFQATPTKLRTFSLNDLNNIPGSILYAPSTHTPQLLGDSTFAPLEKKNQITSTPLLSYASDSAEKLQPTQNLTLNRLESFKDLSDIYPERKSQTPQRHPARDISIKAHPPKTPSNRYAPTLPTLDVNEYSPTCALIPGPMLALRGLGIPDAYFEKPRYLMNHMGLLNKATSNKGNISVSDSILKLCESPTKSLSSSQMDDSTLDRMIDAIIASSHKQHKPSMKSTRQTTRTTAATRVCSMSPTYTPAFDPASDLDEIWWNTERRYFRDNAENLPKTEYLLSTPKSHKLQQLTTSFRRRHQRPVRRKRKLASFRNSVKNSARKLLKVGNTASPGLPQLNEEEEHPAAPPDNPSPDSGHNSSSGDSSKTENHELEVTKRRLSFSKDLCN